MEKTTRQKQKNASSSVNPSTSQDSGVSSMMVVSAIGHATNASRVPQQYPLSNLTVNTFPRNVNTNQYDMTILPDPNDSVREYRGEKPIPTWADGDRLYRSLFFQQPGLMCHLKTSCWPKKNIYCKLFIPRESGNGLCIHNISLSFDPEPFGPPSYQDQITLPFKM